MIQNLRIEAKQKDSAISNLELRLATKTQKTSSAKAQLEVDMQSKQSLAELEELLQEKVEELGQAYSDCFVFEQTLKNMESDKTLMEEQISEASAMLETHALKIYEQDQMLERMAAQLREHEAYRAEQTERELKE